VLGERHHAGDVPVAGGDGGRHLVLVGHPRQPEARQRELVRGVGDRARRSASPVLSCGAVRTVQLVGPSLPSSAAPSLGSAWRGGTRRCPCR
jgi:hypothetical protein